MKVAYLLDQFPALSETFIRNEVTDHIDAGLDLSVFSLTKPKGVSMYGDSEQMLRHVTYLDLPRGTRQLLRASAIDLVHGGQALRTAWALQAATWRDRISVFRETTAWRPFRGTPDIVHCHFGVHAFRLAALKATGQLGGRLITTFHGADISRRRGRDIATYYRQLFRVGDLFLPISNHWAARLLELGCPRDRISVHHMGVKLDELPARDVTRSETFRLAAIGRCVEKKGHGFTIKAMALARQRRPNPAITLDLIGDGPMLNDLKKLAEQAGIAAHVRFHGAQPHAQALALLSRCDAVVLPSVTAADGDQEGIPVVLMEAMAMRLPVLSTFHSGIPELVEHEQTGLLCRERDVETLAHYVELLACDRQLRERLGDAGRLKVAASFDTRKLGGELRQRYRELLRNTPRM